MRQFVRTGVVLSLAVISVAAQDWYHDREERFRGEQWRAHIFDQVRTDLDHVWAGRASGKEHERLQKTEQELTQLQRDLDHGRWDNGILNDVIDSIAKSADDQRLSQRDRGVLADDLSRLKTFQDQHNHRP